MTEREWLELKRFLDEHDIEYQTRIVCISGSVSAFEVVLPIVTCQHNSMNELENAYPEIIKAWNDLWNTLKGVIE